VKHDIQEGSQEKIDTTASKTEQQKLPAILVNLSSNYIIVDFILNH
jgi:hypothetical protein